MSEGFEKIAKEAIQQCQAYQARIKQLQSQLELKKKASTVDTQLVQKSVDALIKTGGITQQQAAQTSELLTNDPNAALRALKSLCEQHTDAPPITKTSSVDLSGGSIIKQASQEAKKPLVDQRQQAYVNAAKAMGLTLN